MKFFVRTADDAKVWLAAFGYESLHEFRREYGLNYLQIQGSDFNDLDMAAMNAMRCGVPADARRRGAPIAKWGKTRITIGIEKYLPTNLISKAAFEETILRAYQSWGPPISGVSFELTRSADPDILVTYEKIDGKGNTLAYAYFPPGIRLPMVLDVGEGWNQAWGVRLFDVAAHEGGHNLGIDHNPAGDGNSLMDAFYNEKISGPQPGYDTTEARKRYPLDTLPPGTPTTPPNDPNYVNVQIRRDAFKGFELIPRR